MTSIINIHVNETSFCRDRIDPPTSERLETMASAVSKRVLSRLEKGFCFTPGGKSANAFGPPPYSLEEGIRETVDWLNAYWDGNRL